MKYDMNNNKGFTVFGIYKCLFNDTIWQKFYGQIILWTFQIKSSL